MPWRLKPPQQRLEVHLRGLALGVGHIAEDVYAREGVGEGRLGALVAAVSTATTPYENEIVVGTYPL